ncbi:organic cation transporter protein-like [Pecten maximus]|uniref:organic cation transporter protein-like n=1 Tax=Pecten maximus TaxID=6579 RepID=UPI001458A8D9|nr:organic cation transporter protein-like [Pecten maximus]
MKTVVFDKTLKISNMKKFDEILGIIGEFGFYQKCVFLLVCLPYLISGFHMVMSVFVLGIPDHRCALPGYPNDTFEIQSPFHEALIKRLVPPSTDETLDYAKCDLYDRSYDGDDNSTDLKACTSWVYDKSIFINTFTSEQNIVCKDKLKTSHAQMIFFGGVLVGAICLGSLSDIIGRKKTLYLSFLMLLGTTLSLAWAPDFTTFCILRFLIGASCAGMFMTVFVIGMELVGPSKRMWAGIVIMYFFALGMVILCGIGYAFKEWKSIQIACAAPSAFFLLYWWLIPESPRWLISQGKIEEANKIIQKAAKVNKVTIPENILTADSIGEQEAGRLWHLFTSRVLLIRTLIIFFNWGVVSMVYYGLSLNTGNLGGDFYINFLVSALVEFPTYTLCLLLLDRVGRRLLHASCMIFGGIACIVTLFPMLYGDESLQPITVTLAMLGKVGIAAAFGVIYVWSAELYPTVVRNAGMGASSSCARIGGMIAPYIADLSRVIEGNLGRAVPLVVFGGASVVAGILSLWLPETNNKDLPETIQDGRLFDRKESSEKYEPKLDYDNKAFDTEPGISQGESGVSTATKL